MMAARDSPTVGRHTRLADSDSDDEPHNVLTLAKASDLCPKPYRLVARNQNITELADLSSLSALDYIDLTSNSLTSLEGIDHPRLKTLIVAKNNLTEVKPIYKTASIRVLNTSENQLPDLEWLRHTAFAPHLLTLVASSNRLHSLAGLTSLSSLQTLVISNNELEDLTPITRLTSLVKLSASNNRIRTIPSLSFLEQLVELRLAHNRIAKIPEEGVSKLRILDMGHNRLTEVESLSIFAPLLEQVNLRQNPVAQRDDFDKYVKGLCDTLEVIDGQRVTGGRRKVRVNRIRRAVGFEVERDRKFARMPSDYYLKRLEEKSLPEATVKEAKKRKTHKNTDEERIAKKKIDDEEDVELGAEKFVDMAKAKSQSGQPQVPVKVKIHGRIDGEAKKVNPKRRKRYGEPGKPSLLGFETFGDGGASRW